MSTVFRVGDRLTTRQHLDDAPVGTVVRWGPHRGFPALDRTKVEGGNWQRNGSQQKQKAMDPAFMDVSNGYTIVALPKAEPQVGDEVTTPEELDAPPVGTVIRWLGRRDHISRTKQVTGLWASSRHREGRSAQSLRSLLNKQGYRIESLPSPVTETVDEFRAEVAAAIHDQIRMLDPTHDSPLYALLSNLGLEFPVTDFIVEVKVNGTSNAPIRQSALVGLIGGDVVKVQPDQHTLIHWSDELEFPVRGKAGECACHLVDNNMIRAELDGRAQAIVNWSLLSTECSSRWCKNLPF